MFARPEDVGGPHAPCQGPRLTLQTFALRPGERTQAGVGGSDLVAATPRERGRGEGVDPATLVEDEVPDVGRKVVERRQMAFGVVLQVAEIGMETCQFRSRVARGLAGEESFGRQPQRAADDGVARRVAAGQAAHDPVGDPVVGRAADPMDEDVGHEEPGDEGGEEGARTETVWCKETR